MQLNPIFSVIIPVYNAQTTVISALQSVSNQTYKYFEVIVVDDGSTDKSQMVIEDYIRDNPNLKITFVKKENGGVSTARNIGLRCASGEFVAFLDADDVWLVNKLERQAQILIDNPHIDFLGTNRNDEFFRRVWFKKFDLLTRIGPKFLLVKFIFVTPTVVFKREILAKIGYFDENQRYAEEGNYFIRICNQYNCFLLNESLAITGGEKPHFGFSGLSGNLKEMELGELKNLKDSLNMGIINKFEYLLLVLFSIVKYFRRIMIVKLRKYV